MEAKNFENAAPAEKLEMANILQFIHNPSEKEPIIMNILKDYILWARVSDGIYQALNSIGHYSGTDETSYTPESFYHGYNTAFMIIGIEEKGDVASELTDILFNRTESDYNERGMQKKPFDELARLIYNDWFEFLKNLCSPDISV